MHTLLILPVALRCASSHGSSLVVNETVGSHDSLPPPSSQLSCQKIPGALLNRVICTLSPVLGGAYVPQ